MEVSLVLRDSAGAASVRFDETQAAALLDAVEGFARRRGDAFTPDYAALLNTPFLWTSAEDDADADLSAALEEGLIAALEDWTPRAGLKASNWPPISTSVFGVWKNGWRRWKNGLRLLSRNVSDRCANVWLKRWPRWEASWRKPAFCRKW